MCVSDEVSINKKFLISPLNWGLGHASRLIPVIRKLQNSKADILLAADGLAFRLLKKEFPEIKIIQLPDIHIRYSKRSNQFLPVLLFIPEFIRQIRREHKFIERIVDENEIDVIISDNRYGLWSKKAFSAIITHQLQLSLPSCLVFFEKYTAKLIAVFLKRFDCVAIPDFAPENNLTGKLSSSKTIKNKRFIGILSKFSAIKQTTTYIYDVLCILSGPEPQRSIFEKILVAQLEGTKYKCVIVRGTEITNPFKSKNIHFENVLNTEALEEVISKSEYVISRAGYSTVMDLVKLGKKAILVPTPGQSEQEYLADNLKSRNLFVFRNQNKFVVSEAIRALSMLVQMKLKYSEKQLEEWLNMLTKAQK